ncbi:MAG: hypothetical protein HQM14_19630 [SAR324 cluster bacterium]|nr:hypothetical protein [SAR324 cluster bacterium]
MGILKNDGSIVPSNATALKVGDIITFEGLDEYAEIRTRLSDMEENCVYVYRDYGSVADFIPVGAKVVLVELKK